MKMYEIALNSMKQLAEMLETNEEKINQLVERMRNDNSDVCRELVSSGLLTPSQMCHAALRYELGKSRKGKTVFWMIDERRRVCDGMVGNTWASVLMKERGFIDKEYCPKHCLFGLHLLPKGRKNSGGETAIAVVESVRSCLVLSERFPKYLWMATGYLANLNAMLFLPLKGHRVICFPGTDPTGDTYLLWLSTASEAREYGVDISVSRFLEDHATPEQKDRCIDLVDFLFDRRTDEKT